MTQQGSTLDVLSTRSIPDSAPPSALDIGGPVNQAPRAALAPPPPLAVWMTTAGQSAAQTWQNRAHAAIAVLAALAAAGGLLTDVVTGVLALVGVTGAAAAQTAVTVGTIVLVAGKLVGLVSKAIDSWNDAVKGRA